MQRSNIPKYILNFTQIKNKNTEIFIYSYIEVKNEKKNGIKTL